MTTLYDTNVSNRLKIQIMTILTNVHFIIIPDSKRRVLN